MILRASQKKSKYYIIIFSLIIAIASILRFSCLGRNSFDLQEHTYDKLALDINTKFADIVSDQAAISLGHPLGGITIVHLFLKKINILNLSNELLFRLPSAFSGIIVVIMTYFLSLELFFNRKKALFAAFLTAINPFLVYYSRSSEPYSIISFLSILNYFLFTTLFLQNNYSRIKYISFILINIIIFQIHYFSILILLAEIITMYILFKKKDVALYKMKLFFIAVLFIFTFLIIYIPRLIISLHAQNEMMSSSFVKEMLYPKTYWFLYYSEIFRTYLGFPTYLIFLALMGLLLAIIYFPNFKKNNYSFAIFLSVLLFLICIVSTLHLFNFVKNIGNIYPFIQRYYIYFVPFILIYMTYISFIKSQSQNHKLHYFKNAFITLWITISLFYSFTSAYGKQKSDIKKVVDYFNSNNGPSYNIYTLNLPFYELFNYYFKNYCTQNFSLYANITENDLLTQQTIYILVLQEYIFGQKHFLMAPSIHKLESIKKIRVLSKKIKFDITQLYIFNDLTAR